jgi:hypothetical protein
MDGTEGQQFEQHPTQRMSLGQEMRFSDGRRFRYAKAGAVAVVPGKMYQAPIPVPNHVLQTAAAAAVGARTVAVTLGATAATADQYRDGYLVVDLASNTGFGYIYQVGAHDEVASSGVFTVPLRSSVQVAIATTANSVSLVPNNYAGVILSVASTPTAVLAGVSVRAIPIGEFGFIQMAGNVACLGAGTLVIGTTCIVNGATTGSVTPESSAASLTLPVVGNVCRVAVTTAYSTITLNGLG